MDRRQIGSVILDLDWFLPIDLSLSFLSKKWVLPIIIHLKDGRKRFSDLQESISNISGKMLSERLKELHDEGMIEKIILNAIPLKVKYQLTEKGHSLDRIMFELSILGGSLYPTKIFNHEEPNHTKLILKYGKFFDINKEELENRIKYHNNQKM
jgi:DNA-binding HxlR family transcriptional regulator